MDLTASHYWVSRKGGDAYSPVEWWVNVVYVRVLPEENARVFLRKMVAIGVKFLQAEDINPKPVGHRFD